MDHTPQLLHKESKSNNEVRCAQMQFCIECLHLTVFTSLPQLELCLQSCRMKYLHLETGSCQTDDFRWADVLCLENQFPRRGWHSDVSIPLVNARGGLRSAEASRALLCNVVSRSPVFTGRVSLDEKLRHKSNTFISIVCRLY